jgi:hypothetical protein
MSILYRVTPVIALAGLLLAAACTSHPPTGDFAEITFEHLPDIKLDVDDIEIEEVYVPPLAPPNVDHLFSPRPGSVAVRWAKDRLVAAGTGRRALYIVHDAAIVEERLEMETGLSGVVTIDQSERYTAHIEVEIQIFEVGRQAASLRAEATRSITVPEDASVNEREQVWFRLTEKTMRDLDAELEKSINEVFAGYLL